MADQGQEFGHSDDAEWVADLVALVLLVVLIVVLGTIGWFATGDML